MTLKAQGETEPEDVNDGPVSSGPLASEIGLECDKAVNQQVLWTWAPEQQKSEKNRIPGQWENSTRLSVATFNLCLHNL